MRLDAPPMNMLTLGLLDELTAAVAAAEVDSGVRGIVIIGDQRHFSAGADVDLFRQVDSDEDAMRLSRVFQEAFDRIEDSTKPVVAAVAGKMLGGALELAMACHARVATDGCRFGMPEVNLGINPGAGGTQRLPRLIGAERALTMLLGGKTVSADEARQWRLVDAIGPAEELLTAAREMALSSPVRKTRELSDETDDLEQVVDKAKQLAAKHRPEMIAPAEIIETVRVGLEESFQAGLRREQESFARCMATSATRNKIRLFFAMRETGKLAELADVQPGKIERAAVIGMGSMGTGIAQALIEARIATMVVEENAAALEKGTARIRDSLAKRVEQGRLSQQQADRTFGLLSTSGELDQIGDVELVIEAVFEDVALKRSVLARLEDVCDDRTILGTNTSTISLDELTTAMRRPERLVGLHFFNPAHRMPLLEVIRHRSTSPDVLATALGLAKAIRKTPVVVENREGFLVNRLFLPYMKEAFYLLEDGAEPSDIDRAMVEFGFPMGPLTLIDMAGLDILLHTDWVLTRAFPEHGALSPIVTRLVDQGHLGQKTGAGVYQYRPGEYTPLKHESADRIVAQLRREKGITPGRVEPEQITRRLLLRMVAEAYRVLQEGIVRRPSDLDVAMVLGIGFPDFRGGVLQYAEELGPGRVTEQLDELAQQFGARFKIQPKPV